MTDLTDLVRKLKEQIEVITAYLAKNELQAPSFLPSQSPVNTTLDGLPREVEQARKTAHNLSWSIHQLLNAPHANLMWTACQVHEKNTSLLIQPKVLRDRCTTDDY